jgi:hypothetical protein
MEPSSRTRRTAAPAAAEVPRNRLRVGSWEVDTNRVYPRHALGQAKEEKQVLEAALEKVGMGGWDDFGHGFGTDKVHSSL